MKCPVCKTSALRPIQYEGVTIETCDVCGGEFLDSDELGHIVKVREERFPDEAREMIASRTPEFGVPASDRERQLACPKCDHDMTVMNYCGDSAIYVDRCTGCGGFWLDADELEHVQIYQEEWEAMAPGMIQAIAADLEQSRRELAESTANAFTGSRFAFVNALINRFLDAA